MGRCPIQQAAVKMAERPASGFALERLTPLACADRPLPRSRFDLCHQDGRQTALRAVRLDGSTLKVRTASYIFLLLRALVKLSIQG
jgi:hypothetical protein